MGNVFWSLGPLAIFLCAVVGYGCMAMTGPEPGSWVDYLFWSIMGIGTLPAVVLLVGLQLKWLRECLERHVRHNRRRRLQPALHI